MSTWTWELYETMTGAFRGAVGVADCNWESKLTGQGRAKHTLKLFNTGLAPAWWQESSKGNKYTLVQRWGTHVAYAGVIGTPDYDEDTQTMIVESMELRAAYMDARMTFGVFSYVPGEAAVTITGKSHSGAARAVINAAVFNNPSYWHLPIDLPADGAGLYSAAPLKNERLTWEDLLSQIEADGCEIYFRPYLTGGALRWETIVQTKVTIGTATATDYNDPAKPLRGLRVRKDYTREMTGILAFGKGGTDATAYGYSPGDGAAEISVRDTWVSFPDLDGDRVPSATQALDYMAFPIEQWSVGASVWPDGPAKYAPGRRHDITIAGSPYLPDDMYEKRVVAVRGDAGTFVGVELQDAA